MAEEIKKDEIISDEQLDQVAGGTYDQSYYDMMLLRDKCGIGFDPNSRSNSVNKLAALYQRAGTIFRAHNGDDHPNEYYDGRGNPVSEETAINDLIYKINAGIINVNDLRY